MIQPHFLAPFIRSFFEDHLACQRNVSRNTIQSYRDGIKLFLQYMALHLGKPVVDVLVTDVTELLILAFLTDLELRRGNGIQTRNQRLVGLRRLFDYIAWREPLVVDHCRQLMAVPRKRGQVRPEIGYLEKHEIAAILQTAEDPACSTRRDYPMLLFMYNTGARVQEVADARRSWLSLHAPYKVQLLGKGRKLRTCPLWESTVIQLRHLLDHHDALPEDHHLFVNRFGDPLSRSGIADIIHRHVRKAAASVPSLKGRRVTPHTFRHTTAMHLLQSGVEVNVIRSWLGHVSIATTNSYIEIDLAMKAKALQVCEVGLGPMAGAGWHTAPDLLTWLTSL
jgi:site-specific recombinase XerD